MQKSQKNVTSTLILFALFAVYTVAVKLIDVQAIGPLGSTVGFATLNSLVNSKLSYNATFFDYSQYLGYAAIATGLILAVVGLIQLIQYGFRGVDKRLYVLGAFYIIVFGVYVVFEKVFVVNFRPIILEEGFESSFPSSHTVLACCFYGAASIGMPEVLNMDRPLAATLRALFILLGIATIVVRFLSGVHWITDIIGGALASSALISLLETMLSCVRD